MEIMASVSRPSSNQSELSLINKPLFVCKECGKVFSLSSSLSRHKKIHLPGKAKFFKHPCGLCRRKFNHLKHLTFHMKTVHSIITPKTPKMYRCALCKVGFPKDSILYHLKRIHDVQCVSMELEFKDFQEFLEWKENIESETNAMFVSTCRSKHVSNEYHYYACHRSCECVPRGRPLRDVEGTDKIKPYCPASISVFVRNDECKVTYCSTHTGHSNGTSHSPLSQKDGLTVAGKFVSNLPFEAILHDIRNSACDEGVQRLHKIIKNDPHSVKLTKLTSCPDVDEDSSSSSLMQDEADAESSMSNEPLSSSGSEEPPLKNLKTLLRKIFKDHLNYISNYNEGLVMMKQLDSIQPIIDEMRSSNTSSSLKNLFF